MTAAGPAQELVHGSAIAVAGRGLLILGASGSGKTTLALELIGFGAALISDDQVIASRSGNTVFLSAPEPISGLIEIRGSGILKLDICTPAPLYLIADLDTPAPERVPAPQTRDLCGAPHPVILCRDRPGLAAVLLAVMRAARLPDPYLSPKP